MRVPWIKLGKQYGKLAVMGIGEQITLNKNMKKVVPIIFCYCECGRDVELTHKQLVLDQQLNCGECEDVETISYKEGLHNERIK